MKDTKTNYAEPKARIFERATSELRDVVVIGRDQSGQAHLWSSLNEQQTNEFLANSNVLEPTA